MAISRASRFAAQGILIGAWPGFLARGRQPRTARLRVAFGQQSEIEPCRNATRKPLFPNPNCYLTLSSDVRNVDDAIVQALAPHATAAALRPSIRLLAEVLSSRAAVRWTEVLAAMPNVGEDADFAACRSARRRVYLIDTNVISEARKGRGY